MRRPTLATDLVPHQADEWMDWAEQHIAELEKRPDVSIDRLIELLESVIRLEKIPLKDVGPHIGHSVGQAFALQTAVQGEKDET